MKILLIKMIVILFCVPVYPFIVIGMYVERNSYLGGKTKFREVNNDYWMDVKDAITYRKGR